MKNIYKYLLVLQIVVVFVIFNVFLSFAYGFEGYKTFSEDEVEDNNKEIEWYDDHNFPYRIQLENDDGDYEYEYCNCDDYEDWVEKSDELLEGKEEQKETSLNKKGGKNSLANTNASDNKLDPNVFYGMKKEQCPTEEALYKMEYYKQLFDVEIGNDLNSGSSNHYDDNKTAYFYPIESKQDYVSFIALTQDSLSEYGNTIMIIDFCQFLNDGQGNWLLLENIAPISYEEGFFQDDEEKKKYGEQIEKAKSDLNMLMRLMGVASTQYEYSRDTYGYMLYKQANIQSFDTLYLKKSDYKKVLEANKKAAEEKAAAAKKVAENAKSQQSILGNQNNGMVIKGITIEGIPFSASHVYIESAEIDVYGDMYVKGYGKSSKSVTFYFDVYDREGYKLDTEIRYMNPIASGEKFKFKVFHIFDGYKKIVLSKIG